MSSSSASEPPRAATNAFPANRPRLWSLLLLLALFLGSGLLLLTLLPLASYSLGPDKPQDVELNRPAPIHRYVAVESDWTTEGVEFSRLGAPGRYRLVQSTDDEALWALLFIPPHVHPYFPPRRVVGRSVSLSQPLLTDRALMQLWDKNSPSASSSEARLIIEQQSPTSLAWSFYLSLLLGGIFLASLLTLLRLFVFRPDDSLAGANAPEPEKT
ncbi:MAG: hypothetical protein MK135_01935 [Polyangiaceae bacterium]|nr:hypothetical protein [Polyangiaceae bacterium]